MTSSLVGSEMCIRDRRRNFIWAAAPPPPPPSVGLAMPKHAKGKEKTGTVSYTHLTLPTICSV
eukprot:8511749-Prorocentrum_lima.AAC.1